MRLQLFAVSGFKVAEHAGEHHGARVMVVDVGLHHVRVAGLEGARGAVDLVPVAVQLVTIEITPRLKQLPTNLASKLFLAVISADMTREVTLDMG